MSRCASCLERATERCRGCGQVFCYWCMPVPRPSDMCSSCRAAASARQRELEAASFAATQAAIAMGVTPWEKGVIALSFAYRHNSQAGRWEVGTEARYSVELSALQAMSNQELRAGFVEAAVRRKVAPNGEIGRAYRHRKLFGGEEQRVADPEPVWIVPGPGGATFPTRGDIGRELHVFADGAGQYREIDPQRGGLVMFYIPPDVTLPNGYRRSTPVTKISSAHLLEAGVLLGLVERAFGAYRHRDGI